MKKIPKKCLTCAYMEFLDADCELLLCTNPDSDFEGLYVEDDFICELYKVNKAVVEDAKQGCW